MGRETLVEGLRQELAFGTHATLTASMCRYEHDRYKAGFWRALVEAGITLVSDEEAGESVGTSAQAAADFLTQHSAQRQVTELWLLYRLQITGDSASLGLCARRRSQQKQGKPTRNPPQKKMSSKTWTDDTQRHADLARTKSGSSACLRCKTY